MHRSMPTNNPYSTSKRITMMKVTAQMLASVLSNLQNFMNSVTFISIPFNAITIILARTHCVFHKHQMYFDHNLSRLYYKKEMIKRIITRGKGWKNGPIHSSTLTRIPHDIKLASCVCPPTVCWISVLDNEAVIGMQEKKEPTRFPNPCK